ncbi:MAG TPA: hypothetical protein PK147_00790 [Saprospiraceae bacterium]|nr:hypothetical protein [Saprospiraceae bacterium]MCB9328797.1 hypothetical protein [Lewinellaceae bacterium]HPK09930.1 hypothetical protein [Saprospiraceae bacterium]HPQ20351.1 hypothetical protein [Saprospiraceae bacterium]HRX28856.1 hypothetical protein [Saprospiraceae bacterium]
MKKFLILLLAAVFVVSSCSKKDVDDFEYGENITIRVGDVVSFEDGNNLKLVKAEDNRCCCFCDCFWQGYIALYFEARIDESDYEFEYDLHESFENPQPFEVYRLEVVGSDPDRDDVCNTIPVEDYKYTIVFNRL